MSQNIKSIIKLKLLVLYHLLPFALLYPDGDANLKKFSLFFSPSILKKISIFISIFYSFHFSVPSLLRKSWSPVQSSLGISNGAKRETLSPIFLKEELRPLFKSWYDEASSKGNSEFYCYFYIKSILFSHTFLREENQFVGD